MSRIYYFCLDAPQPSGGIKTLYRHVYLLNRWGFDAAIIHQKRGFRLDWHGYQVPILWAEERPQIHASDCLVIPEVMPEVMASTAGFPGRRLVIALSWQPAYSRLRPGQRWQDFGIREVITCSPTVKRWIRWTMGLEARIFHRYIDPALYHPDAGSKQDQIAYTVRKDGSGRWLQAVLGRHPELARFSWLELHNLAEADYAAAMRASRIFVATTLQEGMHISLLEAMACATLVVGYHGVGGADYTQGSGPGQNAVLADNGDLPALGVALEEVLLALVRRREAFDPVIQNGLITARRYQDLAAEQASLAAIFAGGE